MTNDTSEETERLNKIGINNADFLLAKSTKNIANACDAIDKPGNPSNYDK